MENNLIRDTYWNPYFANTNRGNGYELDNIIIYNDYGVLIETGCGWFNESNNNTGSTTVKNDIIKANKGTEEKHKKEHHNFIIKTEESYKDGYTLYIYYKNIDYKVVKIEKRSLFIEIDYQLFDNKSKTYSKAIGQSKKFSDAIYWELRKELKETESDSFKYDNNMESLEEHLKNIKKLMKKYNKMKEEEKSYSIEKFIDTTATEKNSNLESFKNNMMLLGGK